VVTGGVLRSRDMRWATRLAVLLALLFGCQRDSGQRCAVGEVVICARQDANCCQRLRSGAWKLQLDTGEARWACNADKSHCWSLQ